MKQFLTFIKKEFAHVFRDKKTLLLLFGMPIAQIILFGFALTNEIKNSRIVILDQAHDVASTRITERFKASSQFQVMEMAGTAGDIDKAFKSGNTKLGIVIPPHFSRDLIARHEAPIQIIADASDPNTASTLSGYATAIIMEEQDLVNHQASLPMQIRTDIRMMYNPELKGVYNFVPGVMALVLLLVCVLMTSVSIVREKERGTMEVLLVSPFHPVLVVLSKAIPYFVLSIVNLTIILLLSVFVMGMPINGSIALLYAESSLLIMTALALGLLISNSTDSQQTAMIISLMGMLLPTMIFTGFMFPLENMPVFLQVISNIVPSKWYYIIIKSVMIKGLGIEAIWKETLILAGMGTFLMILSIKKFKRRLE